MENVVLDVRFIEISEKIDKEIIRPIFQNIRSVSILSQDVYK